MNTSWTLEVQEDPESGDLFIELNDEILKGSGLKEGDVVEWVKDEDNDGYILRKKEMKEPTELVMVETIHMFRMRYVVEVPQGKADWALDTVTCEEAHEFSQLFVGETILSHRVVTEDEVIELSDKDNSYTSSWTRDKKLESFVTRIGDKKQIDGSGT